MSHEKQLGKYILRALFILAFSLHILGVPKYSNCDKTIVIGLNGEGWKLFQDLASKEREIAKLSLIRGIYEGVIWCDSPTKKLFYTKTTYQNLIKSLDEFYRDLQNEKVTVTHALIIISMKLHGVSNEVTEKQLQNYREFGKEVTSHSQKESMERE